MMNFSQEDFLGQVREINKRAFDLIEESNKYGVFNSQEDEWVEFMHPFFDNQNGRAAFVNIYYKDIDVSRTIKGRAIFVKWNTLLVLGDAGITLVRLDKLCRAISSENCLRYTLRSHLHLGNTSDEIADLFLREVKHDVVTLADLNIY